VAGGEMTPPELAEFQNENEKENENEYSFDSSSLHHFISSSPHLPCPPQNGDQQAIPFEPKTKNDIELADAPRAMVSFGRCPRIGDSCIKFLRFSKNQREIPSFSRFISGFK
jgi:hypothetical protein